MTVNGIRAATRPAGITDLEVSGPVALDFVVSMAGKAATLRNETQWVDTPAALWAVSEHLRG